MIHYSTFAPDDYEDPDFDYLFEDDGVYRPDDDAWVLMALRDHFGSENDDYDDD